MSTVEAIYQSGIFRPLGVVALRENQKVRLSIQPLEEEAVRAWLAEVQRHQQQIIAQRGCFPDSTADIAADRRRDE